MTEQPKSDIRVQFIQTTASNAVLNTNTAENLSRGCISGTATTSNLESEFDNELIEENATDQSPNWLTCAGELSSFLVENLILASNLLEEVKGDRCPLIEVFLTSAEEITRNISQTANKVNKTCTVLLRNIKKRRKKSGMNVHPYLLTIQVTEVRLLQPAIESILSAIITTAPSSQLE